MPTIEFIGLGWADTRGLSESFNTRLRKELKEKEPEIAKDTVMVNYPESTVTDCDGNSKPFVRIWTISDERFEKIKQIIEGLTSTIDIEHAQMKNFFPATKQQDS